MTAHAHREPIHSTELSAGIRDNLPDETKGVIIDLDIARAARDAEKVAFPELGDARLSRQVVGKNVGWVAAGEHRGVGEWNNSKGNVFPGETLEVRRKTVLANLQDTNGRRTRRHEGLGDKGRGPSKTDLEIIGARKLAKALQGQMHPMSIIVDQRDGLQKKWH